MKSCVDGTCEVRVVVGVVVPLPGPSLKKATVSAVSAAEVELSGTFSGGHVGTSGTLSIVGPSATGPGTFSVTMPPGGNATLNRVVVDVVAADATAAVLRVRPE